VKDAYMLIFTSFIFFMIFMQSFCPANSVLTLMEAA
jgi:hypothetical protein